MPVIQAEGLEAVFECLYPGAIHDWFINGTIHSSNTEDIVATLLPSVNSPEAILRRSERDQSTTILLFSVECLLKWKLTLLWSCGPTLQP